MKRIIFVKLMLLLTIISISSKAFSQFERGFAGEDTKVYFKLEENQTTISVNVGKYDSRDNVFYTWEVVSQPDGSMLHFSDVFISNPVVEIDSPGEYILKCTQISNYGYQSECVVIGATLDIVLLEAKKKMKYCFTDGEIIKTSDYDFVTDPPGYDELIEIYPGDEVVEGTFDEWPIDIHQVRFRAPNAFGDYSECEPKDECVVLRPTEYISYSEIKKKMKKDSDGKYKADLSVEIQTNVHDLLNTIGALGRLDCVPLPEFVIPAYLPNPTVTIDGNQMANFVPMAISAIGMFSKISTAAMTMGLTYLLTKKYIQGAPYKGVNFYFDSDKATYDTGLTISCCDNKPNPLILHKGYYAFSVGVNLDVPTQLSFGHSGGIYVRGRLAFRNQLEPTFDEPVGNLCGVNKIPVKTGLEVGLGAVALLMHPNVLSVDLMFSSTFMLNAYLNFNLMLNEDLWDCWEFAEDWYEVDKSAGFNISLWLSSRATLMGFKKELLKYRILEYNTVNGLISAGDNLASDPLVK